jgi:hypothetical protein
LTHKKSLREAVIFCLKLILKLIFKAVCFMPQNWPQQNPNSPSPKTLQRILDAHCDNQRNKHVPTLK